MARRLNEYKAAHPEADVVRMDIGDVTLPIAGCVVSAMHRAVEDMADAATFHGYGPNRVTRSSVMPSPPQTIRVAESA